MTLDLGTFSDCDLKVRSCIRIEMAKVDIVGSFSRSGSFDIEVGFRLEKLE